MRKDRDAGALRRAWIGGAAGLACLAAAPAWAEPQALLMVSLGDVPLHCAGETCEGDVSTLCLERERDSPRPGTRYALLEESGAGISVIARRADGTAVALGPAAIGFAAEREYVAVRLSVPRALARQAGAETLAVRIAAPAVLVPLARDGTKRAVRPAEIAEAGRIAQSVLAGRGEMLAVAHGLQRAAAALPRDRASDPAENAAAWAAVADREAPDLPADAVAESRRRFEVCQPDNPLAPRHLFVGSIYVHRTFRACLGAQHQDVMGRLNEQVWDALKPGS